MTLSKKIFVISSVFLALVLVFWGIYNFSFSSKDVQQAENQNQAISTGPASNISSAQMTAISDEAVLAPFIDVKNAVIKYYSKNTGQAYQVDFDGKNKRILSDKNLSGLANVAWSPNGTKVISQFSQEGSNKFFYYDYNTSKGIQLKNNLDTIAWQNDNKIFYKYFDPKTKERTLNISNPDGSNWAKITDLNYKDISIAPIPRTGLVSTWNAPDAFFETDFSSSLVVGGENKSIFKGKFGADFLWNSNGTSALISHSDQKNGSQIQLATINDRGGEYKNLDVATFVSKCAWSKDNKTVYYTLPGNIPANMILPNDYQNKKFTTIDSFWKINTQTGEKTRIIPTDKITGSIDAMDLFLNADESMLFFVNQLDGKIYRVDL